MNRELFRFAGCTLPHLNHPTMQDFTQNKCQNHWWHRINEDRGDKEAKRFKIRDSESIIQIHLQEILQINNYSQNEYSECQETETPLIIKLIRGVYKTMTW